MAEFVLLFLWFNVRSKLDLDIFGHIWTWYLKRSEKYGKPNKKATIWGCLTTHLPFIWWAILGSAGRLHLATTCLARRRLRERCQGTTVKDGSCRSFRTTMTLWSTRICVIYIYIHLFMLIYVDLYPYIYIIIHIQKSWVKWIWEMMNYQPWYLLSTQTCGKGEHETTNPVSHPFSATQQLRPSCRPKPTNVQRKIDDAYATAEDQKQKSHRLIDPGINLNWSSLLAHIIIIDCSRFGLFFFIFCWPMCWIIEGHSMRFRWSGFRAAVWWSKMSIAGHACIIMIHYATF